MNRRRTSLLLLLVLVSLLPAAGTEETGSAAQSDAHCFPETGYCIDGRIREYWEQNGDLAIFGQPITPLQQESIAGHPYQVQWFERNRLELHPDNAPPYDVLLGRLGVDVLTQQGRDWQTFPAEAPQDECRFFAETQQNVCGDILTRWQADGLDLGDPGISEAESLALFGLPISPLQEEVLDGQRYQVQWFERARFELHPENAPPFDVLLGRLGAAGHQIAHVPLQLAVSGRIEGNDDIYLINTNGSDPVRLTTHPESDSFPVWSPDGTRIAFQSYRNGGAYTDIYMMDADGSNLLQLTDNPYWDGGSTWSPDGTRLAFISNRRAGEHGMYLYTMNVDGTDLVRLTDDLKSASSPTWSPDGTRIAFWEGNVSNGVVYVINADGSGLQRLADGIRPRWSPDGSRLVFHTPLPDDSTNTLVTINADGSDPVSVITAQDILTPAWSPDGTQIVFSANGTDTRNGDIFTVNVDGSGLQQLTYTPDREDYAPAWSPDGRMIAFVSSTRGEFSFPQNLPHERRWFPPTSAHGRHCLSLATVAVRWLYSSSCRSSRPPVRGRGRV